MNHLIIGVDPDSEAHGVAIYIDGKIDKLATMDLTGIIDSTKWQISHGNTVEFHIENVCAQNAAFAKKGIKNARAATNVNRSLGMCQQSQKELERALSYLDVKITHHQIASNWKKSDQGKKALKHYTGYEGRSNEDTRSAAYFGYLGALKWKEENSH